MSRSSRSTSRNRIMELLKKAQHQLEKSSKGNHERSRKAPYEKSRKTISHSRSPIERKLKSHHRPGREQRSANAEKLSRDRRHRSYERHFDERRERSLSRNIHTHHRQERSPSNYASKSPYTYYERSRSLYSPARCDCNKDQCCDICCSGSDEDDNSNGRGYDNYSSDESSHRRSSRDKTAEEKEAKDGSTSLKEPGNEESLLDKLGGRVIKEKIYAPEVHKDIAMCIDDIVKVGLTEEEIKDLVEKYPAPSNCKTIEPPILNTDVKFGKDALVLQRDKRIENKQKKNTASLAAAQKGITMLIAQRGYLDELLNAVPEGASRREAVIKLKDERESLLELFSNACRLTADLQHDSSMIRRNLLIGNMHVSERVKEAYKNATIDKQLFGEDLIEKIKIAKANESTLKGDEQKNNGKQTGSKNFKGPLRAGKDYRMTQSKQDQLKTGKKWQYPRYNNSNNNYNNNRRRPYQQRERSPANRRGYRSKRK